MYHVCPIEATESIKQRGLNPLRSDSQRVQFDECIDTVAERRKEDWLPRENAVFAWPGYAQARKYSTSVPFDAAVVDFVPSGEVWGVPHRIVENAYDSWVTGNENRKEKINKVVLSSSRVFSPAELGEFQLWTKKVPKQDIKKVIY